MDDKLKEIYDSLTEEQKEKALSCTTQDELMDFAGEEDIELPEELLEEGAGGFKKTTRKGNSSSSGSKGIFC